VLETIFQFLGASFDSQNDNNDIFTIVFDFEKGIPFSIPQMESTCTAQKFTSNSEKVIFGAFAFAFAMWKSMSCVLMH